MAGLLVLLVGAAVMWIALNSARPWFLGLGAVALLIIGLIRLACDLEKRNDAKRAGG